jgi:two-component system, NtrC family, sensor kinase
MITARWARLRAQAEAQLAGGGAIPTVSVADEKRLLHELQVYQVELELQAEELETTQDQLVQSEKMASLGVLAAGVAHEINGPLSFVDSNVSTLHRHSAAFTEFIDGCTAQPESCLLKARGVRDTNDDLSFAREDVGSLLAETKEGLERIRDIVITLKNYSRAGAHDPFEAGDLHQVMDAAIKLTRSQTKYTCAIRRDYGELPTVACKSNQLTQVFTNLLLNAAQSINRDGVVRLRTGRIGTGVWAEVEDNGEGMGTTTLEQLFTPFFTTKPYGVGTGLGLSISAGIVADHGGTISARSTLGEGSCFRVELPISQPPPVNDPP